MGPVLVLVVVVVIGWMLLTVPMRRRQHAHAAMQDAIAEGDEIITAGGLHAFVREAGGEELRVEIAPGVLVTLDRRAVAAVAHELPVQSGDLPAEEETVTSDHPADDDSVTSQTDTS